MRLYNDRSAKPTIMISEIVAFTRGMSCAEVLLYPADLYLLMNRRVLVICCLFSVSIS